VKTLQTYSGLLKKDKGAVIALGNFDGLHRGHQVVVSQAKSIADGLGAPLGIGLFRPHPYRFFKPDAPPFRLMSAELSAQIMPTLGVDRLYEIPFDNDLREMDDTEFVENVLHQGLGIKHVVVGEDYGFGKNRCGNVESLTRLCKERDIGVTPMKPVGLHKLYGKYGSTEIRKALQKGDVFHAAHMLSRPWTVDGIVQKGEQLGRTLGFPTANIPLGDLVRNSVFIVWKHNCQMKISGVQVLPASVLAQQSAGKASYLKPLFSTLTKIFTANIFKFVFAASFEAKKSLMVLKRSQIR